MRGKVNDRMNLGSLCFYSRTVNCIWLAYNLLSNDSLLIPMKMVVCCKLNCSYSNTSLQRL